MPAPIAMEARLAAIQYMVVDEEEVVSYVMSLVDWSSVEVAAAFEFFQRLEEPRESLVVEPMSRGTPDDLECYLARSISRFYQASCNSATDASALLSVSSFNSLLTTPF